MKLCSLFDGSGGFPLAGSLCGITPAGASEVEPYPIAVTRSRFPKMKHLGDISKIKGAEIYHGNQEGCKGRVGFRCHFLGVFIP